MSQNPEKHKNVLPPVLLGIAAPVAIYITLVWMRNVPLTFLVFHLFICLILPLLDLKLVNGLSWSEGAAYTGLWKMGGSNTSDTASARVQRTHTTAEDKTVRSTAPLRRQLLAGLGVGIAFGGMIFAGFLLLRGVLIDDVQLAAVMEEWGIGRGFTLPLLLTLIVVNPISEEFFWRGYILQSFRRHWGDGPAIALSSLGYMSYHLITTGFLFSWAAAPALSAVVLAAGIFWAVWRIRGGSILPGILSHLLADAGIMLVFMSSVYPLLH